MLNSPNHPPFDASYLDNSQEITRGGTVCFCAKTEKKTKMTCERGRRSMCKWPGGNELEMREVAGTRVTFHTRLGKQGCTAK